MACAHLRRTNTGTSAAAKSGATNPSATAITSELFSFFFSFCFCGKAQTLLQRRSPVSFSFLLRFHEQDCLIFLAFPHIPSVSVTGSYTGTCLLTLRGRPLPRILSLPQRPRPLRPPPRCPTSRTPTRSHSNLSNAKPLRYTVLLRLYYDKTLFRALLRHYQDCIKALLRLC